MYKKKRGGGIIHFEGSTNTSPIFEGRAKIFFNY